MTSRDTRLIKKFKSGDKAAADELIGKYFDRVVRAAQKQLAGLRIHATSEEDIAASVFESLWTRAHEKRFGDGDLANTDELWKLLCTMVRFKASDHIRRERAQRRGGGELRGESIFVKPDGKNQGIAEFAIADSSVAGLAGFREHHQLMMEKLDDHELREVVTMRLEGYKVKEIAEHFSKSERWAKRKLALIRKIWSDEVSES